MTPSLVPFRHEALRTAMLNGDADRLAEMLAMDMAWVHASSSTDDKASFTHGFKSGSLKCFRLDHSQVTYSAFGAAVLVTGVVDMDVELRGERRQSQNRYGALWRLEGSDYRLAYWQSTRLPAPQKAESVG